MDRLAGQLLGALLAGAGSAGIAQAASHDTLDRTAQSYKDWKGDLAAAGPMVQGAYVQILGSMPLPLRDRMTVTAILNGNQELLAQVQQSGELAMGSKEGVKAAKMALALRQQDPGLSGAVGQLAAQENKVFQGEAQLGMSPGQLMEAADAGAGVSTWPGLIGALAGGSAGAALGGLMTGGGPGSKQPVPVRRPQA